MLLITVLKPLPKPVEFPTNASIELTSSRSAKILGIGVVIAILLLYVWFF
jgi:solute:Na+ symporter, SSS family